MNDRISPRLSRQANGVGSGVALPSFVWIVERSPWICPLVKWPQNRARARDRTSGTMRLRVLHRKMNRGSGAPGTKGESIRALNVSWAGSVIVSTSSNMTILRPTPIHEVRKNSRMRSRTVSMVRSSLAFRYMVAAGPGTAGYMSAAKARARVVLPVPGGPCRIKWGVVAQPLVTSVCRKALSVS